MTVMDSRWLEQCREGDSLAIERLVQTYQGDVYRLALSILDDADDADDSTQEVFLSALRALESFRGQAAFKTWLFSITVNVCRNRLTRHKSRGRLQQVLQNGTPSVRLMTSIALPLSCATITTCPWQTSPKCSAFPVGRSTPA
jgi:DNA-directed RNA polymerase specialized sigma24 family protein